MTGLGQYLGGLGLCVVVALVYSMARKDTPRAIFQETAVVFIYILGAISAVTLFVLVCMMLASRAA